MRFSTNTIFFDYCCPRPYSLDSIKSDAIGGTESTALFISEALNAPLVQHNRMFAEGNCLPMEQFEGVKNLVVLRDVAKLYELSRSYPNANLFLWCHDLLYLGSDRANKLIAGLRLFENPITIVAVSDYHNQQIVETLEAHSLQAHKVHRIYNPLSPILVSFRNETETKKQKNKLVFFSSPHKGLENALSAFRYLKKKDPSLTLYLANPGYQEGEHKYVEGVCNLGKLSPTKVYEHVQSAELVFYPNFVYPETFGIVFIEANFLGTPVLTHPIGSAKEVLNKHNILMEVPYILKIIQSIEYRSPVLAKVIRRAIPDALIYGPYARAITNYRNTKPSEMQISEQLLIRNVAKQWKVLLG
jgi:glycosyltransferase involved in cell wall biosynthesis